MLIFQGVLFLPYSRNRRNSKWTSSWFSIENVLKVDFLFAYVYLLKGDLRKLNKNGDIEILYSYIIYFFSNFLHINWCSNSGLLDFRFLGPNSHSCITSPWSFLPGRWVPSNHRKIPLQAFQQALHVGYGMGRHAGKWLVRKMFHFFGWVSQMLRSEVLEIHCRYAKWHTEHLTKRTFTQRCKSLRWLVQFLPNVGWMWVLQQFRRCEFFLQWNQGNLPGKHRDVWLETPISWVVIF